MGFHSVHPQLQGKRLMVERQFQGSVFDVADARRFARVTATWWGVDAAPVEQVVDELARRSVCSQQPRFRVLLSFDGVDVRVRVEQIASCAPVLEGPARIESLRFWSIRRR